MIKNILLFVLFFILLFPQSSNAQTIRSTTFDDREICEKDHGVWREFGNGCVGSCIAKFDKYIVCTMALTYSCDCGAGRCWEDGKCVNVEDYKIIFDEKQAKKKEKSDKNREARKEDFETNRQAILKKLLVRKNGASSNNNTFEVQEKPSENLQDFKGKNPLEVIIGNNQDQLQNKKNKAVSTIDNVKTQEVAPAKNKFEIPSFFLKMKEKEREIEEKAKKQDETNNTLPVDKELEGLPIIPLPN